MLMGAAARGDGADRMRNRIASCMSLGMRATCVWPDTYGYIVPSTAVYSYILVPGAVCGCIFATIV